MRHVYPTTEIPHLWAHQTQEDARNPQGNLYFRGATIYSYRDSWPLARIYTRMLGRALVLSNSDHYSVTTAAHQSAVNRAVSHMPQIAVPNVIVDDRYEPKGRAHAQNIAHLTAEIEQCAKKAGRRTTERAVQWDAERAAELHKALADYLIFFRIRRKCPPMPGFAAAFERARRIENPDPASRDKRERASAKRRERAALREFIRVGAARSDWRLGHSSGGLAMRYRPQGAVMLRVSGDQIETSHGARIPLEHAPRIWRLTQACIASGRPYERNGHTEHAGAYAIDRIDADGTLHAGCHTIPHSEIRIMARALGLA